MGDNLVPDGLSLEIPFHRAYTFAIQDCRKGMAQMEAKRDIAVSMRFERSDLGLIDRGAKLSGLSRTEFMRRAALNEAQLAILNETVVRLSPNAWRQFQAAIEAPVAKPPAKLMERLKRRAPWREGTAERSPTS